LGFDGDVCAANIGAPSTFVFLFVVLLLAVITRTPRGGGTTLVVAERTDDILRFMTNRQICISIEHENNKRILIDRFNIMSFVFISSASIYFSICVSKFVT
jgi:hypothetical protein